MPVVTPHIASTTASSKIKRQDLTISMLDPLISGSLNLFRLTPRVIRDCSSLPPLHLGPVSFGASGLMIEAICGKPLAGEDLEVLQMLVSVAAVQQLRVIARDKVPYSDDELELLEAMHGTTHTRFPVHNRVELSLTNMLELLAWKTNQTYRNRLRESINRLSSVELTVHRDAQQDPDRYKLISCKHDLGISHKYRKTQILLNPRQSQILNTPRHKLEERLQYVKIHLTESHLLNTNILRILHLRLCQWIDPGACRKVSVEKLINYVTPEDSWIDQAETHLRAAGDNRRLQYKVTPRQIIKALNELERKLGWEVSNERICTGNKALESTISIARPSDVKLELPLGTSSRRVYCTSALLPAI